jgi:hypothetical protein
MDGHYIAAEIELREIALKMASFAKDVEEVAGNFCKKYWNDEKGREINFPSTLAELSALAKAGKLIVDGKEFKLDESSLCQWAYRGFSLQHQGAEPMNEEEKKASKEKRAAGNSVVKQFASMERDKQDAILAALAAAGHDISAMKPLLKPAK